MNDDEAEARVYFGTGQPPKRTSCPVCGQRPHNEEVHEKWDQERTQELIQWFAEHPEEEFET